MPGVQAAKVGRKSLHTRQPTRRIACLLQNYFEQKIFHSLQDKIAIGFESAKEWRSINDNEVDERFLNMDSRRST